MPKCYVGPPKVPTFNLSIDVWQAFPGLWVWPPVIPPTFNVTGQLTLGERVCGVNTLNNSVYILFPKLTDVHWARAFGAPDVVVCPAGSGRAYQVQSVDDVGKGFLNEYRQTQCVMIAPYPVPIP